jgi:hypothetical protein
MTKVYIGNATKQVLSFTYRIPGQGARVQTVPIGGQVLLSGDITSTDAQHIIDQNEKYGLIDVKEIDRTKSFIGICYSLDKPIALSYLQRALDKNHEILVERGKEIRTNAALAVNQGLEAELEDNQLGGLHQLEMEVVEESNPRRSDDAGPMVAEGVRVSKDAAPAPQPGRRGGRRAA